MQHKTPQFAFENGKLKDFTLVLCNRDYRRLGQLTNVSGVHYVCRDNSPNELSFSIARQDSKDTDTLWEQVEDFKIVWLKETNEYFEIKVSITDSLEVSKTITGTPVPEAELSQILFSAEINTEEDLAFQDGTPTLFYDDQNPKASLLHRVLSKAVGYHIAYVEQSLKKLQRIFSVSDSTIYDFLVGECSEQFHCIFKFDSADRSIWVYDLETYGEDTTIYVDKTNLTDSISLEVNTDQVKNCFKLAAGDEYMTAAARMLNPSGSDYIYHIPEYLKKDMPNGLSQKLDAYQDLCNKYSARSLQLTEDIYNLRDDIAYLESGMMPKREPFSSAKEEAKKLTTDALGILGLRSLTDSTAVGTVSSAVVTLAKVFVMSGYVKIEVDPETPQTFELTGEDENGYHTGIWTGRLKVTNYSDKTEVAYSEELTISVTDNYAYFAKQKVLKAMTKQDSDGSIFDVLSIENLDEFRSALTLYSKNRLISFYDAIKFAQETLQQLDLATAPDRETAEEETKDKPKSLYKTLYEPYTAKQNAIGTVCGDCKKAIDRDLEKVPVLTQCPYCGSENIIHGELDKRIDAIREKQAELSEALAERNEIISALNLEAYLEDYYPLFSSYRRESVYSNDNFFSDGLTNAQTIEKAKEFIEAATEELRKSSEQQVTISASLYNLLLLPQFAPLVSHFQTGNWIHVRVDGVLYRLRLLSFEVDFDNTQTLNVEFSNVSKNPEVTDEVKDILDSAKSMGQTYGYVAKQAQMGVSAQNNIQDWIQNGLDTGLVQIQSGANKEITTDEHGILCRAYDDVSGTYDTKQLKITNNCIVFTDNNWQSVRQAIGEHHYGTYDESDNRWAEHSGYGLTSDFVQSGQVTGATIIGGKIYSMNYSNGETYNAAGKKMERGGSYINLETGEFSFGGDSLYYRNGDLVISKDSVGQALGEVNGIDIKDNSLRIDARNIDGTIQNDINIKNQFIVDSDGTVAKITLPQTTTLPWKQITGKPAILTNTDVSNAIGETVTADYLNSLEGLTLEHVDVIKANDLYVKKPHVFNQKTTEYETGITGTYTIGDKTIRIVNGIIVEIQEQSNK